MPATKANNDRLRTRVLTIQDHPVKKNPFYTWRGGSSGQSFSHLKNIIQLERFELRHLPACLAWPMHISLYIVIKVCLNREGQSYLLGGET